MPRRTTMANRRRTLTVAVISYWPTLLIVALPAFFMAEASLQGFIRIRRQTNVSSGGSVNATGNQTSMSATNNMWKAPDGTVGANGTSMGTGGGAGPSSVVAGSNAIVGNQSAGGQDEVRSKGQQSQSSAGSSSNMNGPQQASQVGTASGAGYGVGNSQVDAKGGGALQNGSQITGLNTFAIGGATGNKFSGTNVTIGQILSWSSLFAKTAGVSAAKGENNSQVNIDLRAGDNQTNLGVDGLVSGVNDKPGGDTISLVSGSGTLANKTAAMNSVLVGGVNATSGGSKMVGASNLESKGTNGSTINTFGDLRLNGTGQGLGGFLSNSSANPDGTSKGGVAIQGTEKGANKSIAVNNGIRAIDPAAPSMASIGRGYLEGTGNVASNGTSYVLSNYETGKGPAQMVGTNGQSMGNNSGSALNITNTGNVLTGNQTTTNASSNAMGVVKGQNSVVSGGSMLDLGRQGQSGNSSVVAQGGGNGPSSARTGAGTALNGANNTMRTTNISGAVDANGDQTYVMSLSNVVDQNGKQSAFNSGNATVISAGQGSAQARNSAVMKRRRRDTEMAEAKKWWEEAARTRRSRIQ